MQVRSLGGEDSLEEGMAAHSSILAWRIHGQRSLADYSPWGREESDMTEETQALTACTQEWLPQAIALGM